jgi:2-polyprenyl-3-methyl-5-hydroxy-6-metoxy-1,4-benzoquinol methylase
MTESARHNYDYGVDLGSDTAAVHVLSLVGDARRVLEIGAGPGSITRELARTGSRELTAVEIDPVAVEKLKAVTPRAFAADLNDPQWQGVLTGVGPFDAIVSADVFEHLYGPWRVLAGLKPLLAPGGGIVVSLPHVGHFGIIASLMDQDFEYRDLGLLDRTHIRFFGLKNMQALFDGAGYRIVDAQAVIRPPERTEFSRRWLRLPEAARATLSAAHPFGNVYQVIVKATVADGKPSISLLERIAERIAARAAQPEPWRRAFKEWLRGQARATLSDRSLRRLRDFADRMGVRL